MTGGVCTNVGGGLPPLDWTAVGSSSTGQYLTLAASGPGGGMWVSSDYGATWTQTDAPEGNWVSVASTSDGSFLTATDSGGGIWRSGFGSQDIPVGGPCTSNAMCSTGLCEYNATQAGNVCKIPGNQLCGTNSWACATNWECLQTTIVGDYRCKLIDLQRCMTATDCGR
jgi:hypothetical protein